MPPLVIVIATVGMRSNDAMGYARNLWPRIDVSTAGIGEQQASETRQRRGDRRRRGATPAANACCFR